MEHVEIETLYHKLAPQVTNYLVANGTPHAVACDIVQETFLRIWKMRDQIESNDARITSLIYTIARNIRNDKARHDKFMTYKEDVKENELVTETPTPSPGDADYLRGRLTKALNQLPPLLREAFLLFQVSELSIREISLQLNITEALVKVRIFRAKQKLKSLLADLNAW